MNGLAGTYLRWSWRDLRARWLQVMAIALIIAIGSGVYAGLSSSSGWRRESYDASYRALGLHDLRVELATGSFVDAGRLKSVLMGVDGVARAESRLLAGTQVDVSRGAEGNGSALLVPGRLVGIDIVGGNEIDRVSVRTGRNLRSTDTDAAVLDYHFAKHHELPSSMTARVAGGRELEVVGQGLQPEYFVIQGEYGAMFAEASYAVLFVPIAVAQEAADQPGAANDAVLRVRGGTDRDIVAKRVEAALARELPEIAVTVTTLEEEPVRKLLYDDIEGDQRFYDIFSALILGGATFAAFNLVSRIVDAQRREIGIGMALGVGRPRLALRPLLVGMQVSLLGALLGLAVGWLIGNLISQVSQDFLGLPVWRTPFQPVAYAKGAATGVILPFLATLWPVWRAVRAEPISTLRPGGAAGLRSGLTPWAARVGGTGHSLRRMPFRNVLRTPRRSLLTALAIGTAIATLLGVIGMLDSVLATIDVGEREILADAPDRVIVDLATFQLDSSPTVRELTASPLIRDAEPYLRIGGRLGRGAEAFETLIVATPLDSKVWRPTAVEGSFEGGRGPGVVISVKAARDLGVEVGERVLVRHPVREGLGYRWEQSRLPVRALHGNPVRAITYIDIDDAALFNLAGIVNAVQARPSPGANLDEVKRGLFGLPGVGAVDSVSSVTEGLRKVINESIGVLDVVRGAVLLLAVLIAYNSSSIGADERRREHATMFAFGLPVRHVLAMSVVESLVIGVVGTALGVSAGFALLNWLVTAIIPDTLPDLSVSVSVHRSTVLTAALLGTLAVAVAPFFTARRLRRMDLPATLRVVE